MKNLRANLIFVLFIFLWAAIISKLFFVQIVRFDFYKAMAQGQQKFLSEVQGKRGTIFLKDGERQIPLAVNRAWTFCYISPGEIKNMEETVEKLSSVLSLEKDKILEKINSQNEESLFLVLKQKLNEEEISNIKKINLPGIYLAEESLRNYPQEFLASHVVGFLGGEGEGQYGIEGYFNDVLEGKAGFLEGEKGPLGFLFLNSESYLADKNGSDVLLTIDYNVQFMAEKLLKEAKEKFEIEEGQILVMDPNSGKIIVLANFPSFDPNNYSEEKNLDIFQNSAIQKIFEPGSVFKPITMAAALDQEKITPQTTYTDPGVIKIGGWPIYNYDQRKYPGDITMTEVLEKSINTGAVFAEKQLGHAFFSEYIEKFGFFAKTEIDLQGEDLSSNEEFKKGNEINFATASFGQGIAVTPIQLVRAFAAIANGGKLVRPYVVDKIFENGKISETQPIISSPIISQRTADQLTAMLVSVIENGYGKAAKIPGYYIAGKTGTAQVSWSALGIDKKGYSDKTIQTFIGFAPAFKPRFIILVKLNNPKTKTAEYSAVPIFQELAKYVIDLWQIPPDYE
jgi:cell division protein FtsI (penicillin-binding protein 3)/stage V sporulation protein D (sporulation-specific penicillin-binding protein)